MYLLMLVIAVCFANSAVDNNPAILYHSRVSERVINEYFNARFENRPGPITPSVRVENVGFFDDLIRGDFNSNSLTQDWDRRGYWEEPWTPRTPGVPGEVKVPEAAVDENATRVVFNHDDMKNSRDWKVKHFDVVVVVDKSAGGQSMQVYRKTSRSSLPERVFFTRTVKLKDFLQFRLTQDLAVSTGREQVEMSNADKQACAMDSACSQRARELRVNLESTPHAPADSYFSQTEPGYYTPQWLSIDHVSAQWEDSAMDHAVFFNNGTATHRAPSKYESRLGKRASGACVRMNRDHARELFWMIRATGGPYREGELRQGRKFWFDGGTKADWTCNDPSCIPQVEKFLPKDCTKVSDRALCLELERNLPWRCYTKRMKEDRLLQVNCLAEERVRVMKRSKPFFESERVMAAQRGWIPYSSQSKILIPEFDRFTGQVLTNRLVPGAYKTLIVIENRQGI